MTSGPSSNWIALQKRLGRSRKPKVDGARNSPPKRRESAEPVDVETEQVKDGESMVALREMVLGKAEYSASQAAPGKYLALDCEMVGVGIEGDESSLARVSIVNFKGAVILDVFVRQRERVVDYRTQWSGVRSADLGGSAKPFKEVQQTVADLIKDRILVGHAIYNDLKALLLSHPSPQIRDTQSLAYKHRVVKSRRPALRVLVKQELGLVIQGGEHDSVTDARATMALFRLYKKQWESGFKALHRPKSKNQVEVTPASKTMTGRSQPSASSLMRGRKRKRSDDDGSVDGADEELSARGHHPSLMPAQDMTQRISAQRHKHGSRTPSPSNSTRGKGISSGITIVTKRAGGKKEVWRKGVPAKDVGGKGGVVRNSRKTGGVENMWWKSLGGGKKGSTKV